MHKQEDHYEYIVTVVDDLLVFSKNPGAILDTIRALYSLKSVGIPDYFLGADVYQDEEDGKWCISAKTYIKQVCERIEKVFDTSEVKKCGFASRSRRSS